MRTQAEIYERAKLQFDADNTGFEWTLYIDYLTYEQAQSIVKMITKSEWQQGHDFVASTTVLEQMRKYLPFAWKKAASGRNLSAQRSLRHYVAWFWLIGNDEMADAIEIYLTSGQYEDYGKEMLTHIENVLKEAK